MRSRRIKQKYYEPKTGEWVQPVRKGYRLACCYCGLVHAMNFRLRSTTRGKFIQFQVFGHNRATAAIRAAMSKKGQVNGR